MSGKDTLAYRARQALLQFPGKRGIDIPEADFDRIHNVASGITQQVWGRPPTPHQMQWLWDNGHHTPEAIHAAFGALPHPHAPNLSVDDYQRYAKAHDVYRRQR